MNKYLKIIFWILVILLTFFLINTSIKNIIHSKKEVVVPNIEGKSLVEALNLASKSGLGLRKVGESFNKELPVGAIISQYPKVGMVVREGRYINVVISLGGEKVFVPNIVGEFRRKAELILRQYSLSIGTVTENYSLRYQKDRVISQEPVEGTVVDKNASVNFIVSLGIPPEDVILVPEFVNRNIEDARLWAEKVGLPIEIKEVYGKSYVSDIVISQNPPADTLVSLQDKLEIVVGRQLETKGNTNTIDSREPNFFYEIPSMGNVSKNVKILQVSPEGEQILYNKPTAPGTRISLYVPQKNNSKLRIFIDGILIDEK